MARSSPVGVGEQEGGEEGVEDIMRKSLMVVVRKQEVMDTWGLVLKKRDKNLPQD
jgi:hypothetical protein